MRLGDAIPKEGSRKRRRRPGRGISAGQGASCGFGMRGQKSRSGRSTRPGFEGGQMPLYRRLPKLKRFPIINRSHFTVVNLETLASLEPDTQVTLQFLQQNRLVQSNRGPLKVLGKGVLNIPLKITASVYSKMAWRKILSAGGSATFEDPASEKNLEEATLKQLLHEVESLLKLPKGWDGYAAEPPNKVALEKGRIILDVSMALEFLPSCVSPSAEGGIGISFLNGQKYADIECFNTGEVAALISNRGDKNREPEVWEVHAKENEIEISLKKIRDYLYTA